MTPVRVMIGTVSTVGIVSAASVALGAYVASLAGQFPAQAETLQISAGVIVTGGLMALGAALLPILERLSTCVGHR